MSRSFGWAVSELPSSGDLDPCSRHHTAEHAYTLNYEEPHIAELGLDLYYGERSRPKNDAELYLDNGFIVMRPGMTWRKERCTLTHEVQHALRGDRPIPEGVELRKREKRVDRLAAELLIEPRRLQKAMIDYADPADWCLELNVTSRLLRVFMEHHPEVREEAEIIAGIRCGERVEVMR